ncbi:hypothetical protein F5Y04DRAFT_291826 [Hypomontagnella monticulosa]|nr:hypothetical protein F5Y04DRAFT_291826 [Hypomontagnella monticulosa]
MPIALINGRSTGDAFSKIAIASRLGGKESPASITGDGNRDPSWLWPPPLYQPYCRLHFLKECSLYHLRENEVFKAMAETNILKSKKSSKWPAAPTRVQPARRAREKNWKDQPNLPTSRQNSPSRQDRTGGPSTALESRHEQLQLHLSWPIYKNQIESRINGISSELIGTLHESVVENTTCIKQCLDCRYCRFNPEVADRDGFVPRKLVPPAPMHFIHPGDMKRGQVGEYGGIKFAIDISNGYETIVLLGMEKLKDIDCTSVGRTGTKCCERGGSEERSTSTRNINRSKKKSDP